MFRSSLIENFPKWYFELPMGDWPLKIPNAQHGKIGFINKFMANYRIHSDGYWSSFNQIEIT